MTAETSKLRGVSRPLMAVAILAALVVAGRFMFATVWNPLWRRSASVIRDSGLLVAADYLDFGEVWEDRKFEWVLPVENPLGFDHKVDLVASCSCVRIEPRSLIVPSKQTRKVTLTLDLTAKASKVPESEWRDFSVTVRPVLENADGKFAAAGWTLRGRIHSAVHFERQLVDFGRHSEFSQPLQAQIVSIASYVPVRDISVEGHTQLFQAEVNRLAQDPRTFELKLWPKQLPTGPIDARLSIVPQLESGERLPGRSLDLRGYILADVQASPPEAVFGAVAVGDKFEETITLSSLTSQPFQVLAASCDGDGLAIRRLSFKTSENPVFILTQRATKRGAQANQAKFRVQPTNGRTFEVIVPVSYLGI